MKARPLLQARFLASGRFLADICEVIRVGDEAVQFGNGVDAIRDFQKKSLVRMSLIRPCSHSNKPADHRQTICDAMISFAIPGESVRCLTGGIQRV